MARILVVDDEAAIVSALRRLFVRSGHEVATASSGEEALAKLVPFAPDVVLSDFRMPGMNGAELHTQVRRRWPFALRIILSGFADLASMASAINEGEVCRFINKPWDGPQLVAMLEGLLSERTRLSQIIGGLQTKRALNPQQVSSHARSIEVRMDLGDEPLSAARAMELIAELAGLAKSDHHALVSGLLERRGGRLTFSAEIGGPRELSIDVPVEVDVGLDTSVAS